MGVVGHQLRRGQAASAWPAKTGFAYWLYRVSAAGRRFAVHTAPNPETPMNPALKAFVTLSALAFSAHAAAQVTFYERDNFDGRYCRRTY